MNKKSIKKEEVTATDYATEMDKIIMKTNSVPDALIAMIEYARTIKIKQDKYSRIV